MIDELSAALYGEVVIRDGVSAAAGFGDYRLLRMGDAPVVHVFLVPSAHGLA
ncbi:MAG TPA: hypothetical protein VIP11_24705 [Gemmatimonadaceae bacterium]